MLKDSVLLIKNQKIYLNFIMVIAPLMNFFSSICFDLYAPSMPAIATHLSVSTHLMKNTITMTMVGFAIGSLIFGVFIDCYGRRKTLIPSMFAFIIVSSFAPFVTSITQLMIIRFFQGMFTAACSIGSRAIIVDYFTGQRFIIAILYTTVAYGFGLMVAPFFGGYLQYYFGWQANFYAYIIVAFFIGLVLFLFLRESLPPANNRSLLKTVKSYGQVLKHRTLLAGIIILGIVLVEQLIYPTIGVFLVQVNLAYSPIIYGYSALAIGCSYLVGTLINRLLLPKFSPGILVNFGFIIMTTATALQLVLALWCELNLWTLALPIMLFNIGLGFIFGNIIGFCLRIFPENAGINLAIQTCYLMLISAAGVFAISSFKIDSVLPVSLIYVILVLIQFMLFKGGIRHRIDHNFNK
ncbi:MFS transporter [Legionella drancourtii]|uniref:Major facilitator superfamily (MFS) profile domain-containing protein n=1 Tax=Legionella drancourtii LLAP12 TaxID=658187 RepID=G9ENR2_9GAMM|nr:MFS transporter [Legionella drancourtii]EHL31085.1 hypothetical protein LDG_6889 [Legionella drancourtii LLAP12]